MTRAWRLAFLLMIVEMLAIGFVMSWLLSVVVALVMLGGIAAEFRVAIGRRTGMWLILALVGLLQFGPLLFEKILPTISLLKTIDVALQAVTFALLVQAAQFFIKRQSAQVPGALPALGIVVMLLVGLQPIDGWRSITYRGLVLVFVYFLAKLSAALRDMKVVHTHASRLRRRVVAAAALAMIVIVACLTGEVLRRFERRFDDVSTEVLTLVTGGYQVGFSGEGDLWSISLFRQSQHDKEQLHIDGAQPPGYLRGRVFVRFSGESWAPSEGFAELFPLSVQPENLSLPAGDWNIFGRNELTAGPLHEMTVRLDQSLSEFVFTPLGTTHIMAQCAEGSIDRNDVFRLILWKDHSYGALRPHDSSPPPIGLRSRRSLTQLPTQLSSDIAELAHSVFADCETTAEKIAAVEHYFHTNYRYELTDEIMDFGAEGDPLRHFFESRPPSHCEMFATGAAVLLRRAQVPCRYVTGFVVGEGNLHSGHWTARGRDAHAWVEAYDDVRGWVIVEATPDEGVPSRRRVTKPDVAATEVIASWFKLITQYFKSSPLWIGLFATVAMVIVAFVWLYFRTSASSRRLTYVRDPMYAEMHDLLDRVDRFVRTFDLKRAENETFIQFSRRIASRTNDQAELAAAATWYPLYAACRYNGDVRADSLWELRATLPDGAMSR